MNDETPTLVDSNEDTSQTHDRLASPHVQESERRLLVSESTHRIVIASTFTTDLLQNPLKFWMETLDLSAEICLAPYAQVMQELLSPESVLSQNSSGINILIIRPEDWIRERLAYSVKQNLEHIDEVASDFVNAMDVSRSRTSAPILVFFCPSLSSLPVTYTRSLEDIQSRLITRLGSLTGVHCLCHTDIVRLYPVVGYEDARADQIGHIPYTNEYFVAMATLLARRIATLLKPRYKVIAVDCDNTLWKGVCGEDGASGVEMTPAHTEFQRMLVRQYDAGVLLCICSKNNPADVEAVFKAHPEMPLREEHLICSRVNWNSKSSNLISISQELGLSLDSFILVDDSPLECAEVAVHCPSILTLQFPEASDEIPQFLDHIWAFDRVAVTAEAKQRTELYRQNRARKEALGEATDLEQFLASLELRVDVSPMQSSQLARVAELIQRTNQFNLTTIRRSLGDIEQLWSTGEIQCRVVHVRDRFGDYGLVGVLFFRCLPSSIDVDTFILSCRVLGRGVEHRIVNELGRVARQEGRPSLVLRYCQTSRNEPAWTFLKKCFGKFQESSKANADGAEVRTFAIPIGFAESFGHESKSASVSDEEAKPCIISITSKATCPTRWQHTAYRLRRVTDLAQEINRATPVVHRGPGKYVAPRTTIEAAIAEIWARVLRLSQIGVKDDFFWIGGDSVRAVQVIAEIASVLGSDLSVYDFFKGPTVEEVAARVADASQYELQMKSPNLPSPDCESITPGMLTLLELDQQQIDNILKSISGGEENFQDAYPLSPLQEGMLFHHLMNEQSDTYVLSILLELQSYADVGELVGALQKVINRHEILRTAILWERVTRPVQVVYRQATLRAEQLALDQGSDPLEQLEKHMRQVQQKWDLRESPLLRLHVSADPHGSRGYAVLQVHHLICDHESLRVLVAEAIACLQGREQDLPTPAPYRDYVARALARARTLDAEAFFRKKLGSIEEPTAPFGLFDVHRSVSQIKEDRRVLDRNLAQQIRIQARRYGVSAARLFHAAWGVLVARTSGRDDVVFGTVVMDAQPISAQRHSTLGMFVNTLPLRLRLQGITVKELVEQTHRELTELLDYSQVSLTLARRCSGITGNAPLITALLNYRYSVADHESEQDRAAGMRVIARGGPWTSYPVTLTVDDSGEEFVLTVKTDGRIDLHRMLGYIHTALQSLIEALQEAPQTSALVLSILPESERRQVLELFNATRAAYPQVKLIHELFEQQVTRTPEVVALVYEGQSLTYSELNCKANQLARYLKCKGIGPDQLVAVCIERSVELLVGLLGILKAGGAYIPLDPTNPTARLEYLLADAEPRVLLTQKGLRSTLPRTAADVITLDDDWDEIAKQGRENLDAGLLGLSPYHLAYVIYTSGSTGKPKGVMVEHHNLVNYAVHALRQFDVVSGNGSLICTSISFDLVLTGLYPTLLCGQTVRLCRELEGLPAIADEVLRSSNLAPLKLTPSHLALLEDALRSGQLAGRVRVLVCGGESLPGSAVQLWKTHAPGTRIFNHYGPTETTVGCVVGEVVEADSGTVPIGRPISNTQIYIVDRHRQLVPIGVAGEIHIAGAGVARGYLNRPELTAERFLADPFSAGPQARMYKTGDLGRWRADGTIEYLGRNDHQLKIRGYRIELGEIEAQLLHHQQVKEAAVISREEAPGEQRLVAYITQRDQNGPSVEDLSTHLKAMLPEYMVPSSFVILERLPLTPNGKVDRLALPVPGYGVHVCRQYEVPQGELEEKLAAIWQQLLRVDRVGRRDNFFEIGGHSLLATRAISRIREALQVALPLRALFDAPTVEQLSARLAAEKLQMDTLAGELRQEISEMQDDAVLARIAALEKELGYSERGN